MKNLEKLKSAEKLTDEELKKIKGGFNNDWPRKDCSPNGFCLEGDPCIIGWMSGGTTIGTCRTRQDAQWLCECN